MKKKNSNNESNRPKKKHKLTIFNEGDTTQGTQWDGNDYSWAYDALFTILFNIWAANPQKNYSKIPISNFLYCMMDSKHI